VLTRIDHVMICVPDLAKGVEIYTRLGFTVYPGGSHTGRPTHNAIAFHDEDYLEILSIRDRSAVVPGSPDASLALYLDQGGGFRIVALQSDDLAADVAAMRGRGVDVGEVRDGGRRTLEGQELRWRAAFLGPRDTLPIFFIQHLTPLAERKAQAMRLPGHPNGVTGVERVYITVPDVAAAARTYARVLGLPVPAIQRGAVIKADMAVFDLGATGLTVAQPAEPGPAAEALARRGPGPFQVLYRTSSMDAAVRWMIGHGLPEPIQGVRNTGERAILVGPEHTGGAYVGFVGPA
jgi:catechol 2,3-dioxygenase-like lactoylglutathione lyase family enzyme